MSNTNCLEGVRCPKCKAEDRFIIQATVDVEVTDDGTEDIGGDYYWDSDRYCKCCDCGHEGTLGDFTIEYQKHPKKRLTKQDKDVIIKQLTAVLDYALEAVEYYHEHEGAGEMKKEVKAAIKLGKALQ